MTPLDELSHLLRPAGGGLFLVSTGREAQLALQRRLYGVEDESAVRDQFLRTLDEIPRARVAILAVPSDVGAGFLRGANVAPQAIRQELLAREGWLGAAREQGVIDLGDVFVVPQLLHDDMLSEAQKEASRRALYPQLSASEAAALPVSPLSIAERALDLILGLNPALAPAILGGDHSVAWPVAAALSRARRGPWGIVQPDAHTDLLEERLGVTYCFATWSYHANERLGRGGRMVQVGIRASRHPREYWEGRYGVRQFWAEEVLRDPDAALENILAQVKQSGAERVYFSNDIDGTDARYADATGTPEPNGLTPDFVSALIRRLGREVGLCAGDIVEVAPPIQRSPDGAARTVALAARYFSETIEAMLASPQS